MYEDDDDDEFLVTKSQIKKEMLALQALGESLVKLSEAELSQIPIPEQLAEAIALAQRIKSHSGLKRQLQFIGKLMRNIDAEPIEKAYKQLHHQRQQVTDQFHQIEKTRDQLLDKDIGNTALEKFLSEHENADRQHIRQLVRQAQKEQSQEKPPAAKRKLFKYLEEVSQ